MSRKSFVVVAMLLAACGGQDPGTATNTTIPKIANDKFNALYVPNQPPDQIAQSEAIIIAMKNFVGLTDQELASCMERTTITTEVPTMYPGQIPTYVVTFDSNNVPSSVINVAPPMNGCMFDWYYGRILGNWLYVCKTGKPIGTWGNWDTAKAVLEALPVCTKQINHD